MDLLWRLREDPDARRVALAVAAGTVAVAGVAALVARAAVDPASGLARARSEVAAQRARADLLQAERNRLRAERNQLEARLAAERPAAVCPSQYLSTGDSGTVPRFEIDYPCGWHVLFDPRPGPRQSERRGLRAEVLLLSRLPISLVPKPGAVADIEVVEWSDDPMLEGDALPPRGRWLEDERAAFASPPAEAQFEVGDGITVTVLSGDQRREDEPVQVRLMLWEYEDAAGARRIVRAIAVAPAPLVARALDRLARSFRVIPR